MSPQLATRSEQDKKAIESDLDELISETIRTSALPNAIAFVAVIGISFLMVIGVLIWVTG